MSDHASTPRCGEYIAGSGASHATAIINIRNSKCRGFGAPMEMNANAGSAVMSGEAAARIFRFMLMLLVILLIVMTSLLTILANMAGRRLTLEPGQYALLFDALYLHMAALLVAGALLVFTRRTRLMPPWFPRVALLAFLLITIMLADRVVGIIFPPPLPAYSIFRVHPVRGWTHDSNKTAYLDTVWIQTDHLGLRIPESAEHAPPPGAKRLLFIGDSITLGYGHRAVDAYGWQAAEILNSRLKRARFHSLNGGISGYDTGQELDWLVSVGLPLKPDLVVLQFCLNDVTSQYHPRYGEDGNLFPEMQSLERPTSRSGLVRGAMALIRRARYGANEHAAAERIQKIELDELLRDVHHVALKARWQHVEHHMRDFVQRCREAKVGIVVVCFPIEQQLLQADATTHPQAWLAALMESLDAPFLDLLPVYRERCGTGREAASQLFIDETHPTVLGNRIAAEALAALLQEVGLVGEE